MHRYLFFIFLFPVVAFAHQPILSEFSQYNDIQAIDSPEISKAYYGNLTGFPHTYVVELEEPEELFIEISVPDISTADEDRSVLIVKKEDRGSVTEVARLNGRTANWTESYEPFGGDSYKTGPSFEGVFDEGSYLIEVSTPENMGKYVLVIGKEERFSVFDIFETMQRIYEVKLFFGKPPIAVFQSPFYYVPAILILVLVGVLMYRKKYA